MVERVFWRRTAGAALGLGAALGCAGAPTPSRTRPLDTPHEAPPMAGEVEWVRPPREPNRAVAWSGDRSLVILGDGTELALWDTPTARPRLSLGKGEHGAFAPSARHLAVSSGATVTVIERATGRAVGTTQLPETQRLVALLEAPLRVVAFHDPQLIPYDPENYEAAEHDGSALVLWDALSGVLLGQSLCGAPVALSPDGRQAVVGAEFSDALARVVTFPDCKTVAAFVARDEERRGLAATHAVFSRDGTRAFVALTEQHRRGPEQARRLLQWRGGSELRAFATFSGKSTGFGFSDMLVDDAGKTLALTNVQRSPGDTASPEDFVFFDVESGERMKSFGAARAVAAFFPGPSHEGSGGTAMLERPGASLRSPEGNSRPLRARPPARESEKSIAGAREPWFYWALRNRDGNFHFIDLEKGRSLSTPPSPDGRPIVAAEIAPGGKHVLLARQDRALELRALTGPGLPLVKVFDGATLSNGTTWSADGTRFVIQRGPADCAARDGCGTDHLIASVTGGEPVLARAGCVPVGSDKSACLTSEGALYRIGDASAFANLGEVVKQEWDDRRPFGMLTTRESGLVLVDLNGRRAITLATETTAKKGESATSSYLRSDFLSPDGEHWVADRQSHSSQFLGSTRLARATFELGMTQLHRWSEDGKTVHVFAGEAWTRIDVETGARSSLGRVLNITANPIVEVEGKPMAFLSDRHLEPIVGVGADALTRVSAVLASGRVLFRAQSDLWTLTRTKDGEELAVLFPTDATSRPLVVSGSGAFSGAASDFDQLTFAPRGRAGDGTLLGGDDIATRCLRPDLLESFVRGDSVACNAPREKGSPERAP